MKPLTVVAPYKTKNTYIIANINEIADHYYFNYKHRWCGVQILDKTYS